MKNLLKLGEELTRTQQQEIKGGLRPVGISDGDCTTGGSCDPYGDSSECELDAVCQGTHSHTLPNGHVAYFAGVCTCV